MEVVRSTGTCLLRLVSSIQKNPKQQPIGLGRVKLSLNPFLLHALIETPASLNFFLNPGGQLRVNPAPPQIRAVIRQYAVLLFSSVLVALSFACRDPDELSGQVAGALALYHLAPVVRATGRLVHRQEPAVWQPLLFVTVHAVCLAGLAGCCWELWLKHLLAA